MPRAAHFVLSASTVFMAAASAWGYCDTFPTVTQEFTTSEFAFVGRVLSSREIAVQSESITGGTFYTLEVSEVLKGKLPHRVRLYSENSSGRFPMVVGARYLIFTDYSSFEGIRGRQLAINNCGNSAPLPKADDALTIVRRLSKRPNQTMQPTAGRRTAKFSMTTISHPTTTRALASGG